MINKRLPARIIILLLLSWTVLTIRLNAPWYGVQSAYRVWIPAAVRNYDIYGVENIGVIVVRDSAPMDDLDDLYYYSHHPAMLVWLPAVLTHFYGYHEAGVRLVFAASMLIATAAFYVFVRRAFDRRLAFPATCFFMLTPMMNYFEAVPGHDPLGFAVITLFAAVLVKWIRLPSPGRFLALLLLAWLAVWTAWPAVFFVAALGLAAMLLGSKNHRIGVVLIGLTTMIAFVALIVLFEASWPGAFDSLLDSFHWRSSSLSKYPGSPEFTMIGWLGKNLAHVIFFTTPPFFALSLMGAAPTFRRNLYSSKVLLLALLAAGIGYLLVFRNASYIHEYYKAFLVPAMAITAAGAWVYLRERKTRRSTRLQKLINVLLLAAVVNSAILLGILHATGHQPAITAIIDYIDAYAQPEDRVVVHYEEVSNDDAYKRVIEFYTLRHIEWNISPEAVFKSASELSERLLYIYCLGKGKDELPDVLQGHNPLSVYQGRCFVVSMPRTPE